jgi:hypothetical protein
METWIMVEAENLVKLNDNLKGASGRKFDWKQILMDAW